MALTELAHFSRLAISEELTTLFLILNFVNGGDTPFLSLIKILFRLFTHSPTTLIKVRDVLALVLTALHFFQTPVTLERRDTPGEHVIKLLHLQQIYRFQLFFVSRSVSKLQRFKKVRAVNNFKTASRVFHFFRVRASVFINVYKALDPGKETRMKRPQR